jgi:AAA+ ATPase superfamily predicted ATPase
MHYPSFTAFLGSSQYAGLLSLEQRLKTLSINSNPYQSKIALAANSPVFVGRNRELHTFHRILSSDNPASISIEGEPRIGKSSLLNQVVTQLQQYDNLIILRCDAQGMGKTDQSHFFAGLAFSIMVCLGNTIPNNLPKSYSDFLLIIQKYCQDYRFVLVLDEFEVLTDNIFFDKLFFDNLRSLGNNPDNRFGFLIASHNSLKSLCYRGNIKGSRFYNIFDVYPLGLLDKISTYQLVNKPLNSFKIYINNYDSFIKYYGCHPYYLQCVLAEMVSAKISGFEPNYKRVKNNIIPLMQDLWLRRTQEELLYLFKSIAKHKLDDDNISYHLESRGLIEVEGDTSCLFSILFKYSLPDELISTDYKKNNYLNSIKQDPKKFISALSAKTAWEQAKMVIGEIGEVYKDFKPNT